MSGYRIVMNVFPHSLERFGVQNPNLRKSLLPDGRVRSELASSSKGKSTLDELHGALNGQIASDSQQQVEVVGHDNEFVQAEFSFLPVVVQDLYEELRGSIGLEKVPLPRDRRSDKECSSAGDNFCR